MNTPEIQELIRLVEQKYGKSIETTTDFEVFSLYLEQTRQGRISASTLKRLWGYVNDKRKPRNSTLDVLAVYIGHPSFEKYIEWLKKSPLYNSSFFTAFQLTSSDLAAGDMVEIGWLPNRRVKLKYVGDSFYEVLEAANSKLMAGDRFLTGCFIKELPLYLPYIIRNGEHTPPFIAGRNGGLSHIKLLEK